MSTGGTEAPRLDLPRSAPPVQPVHLPRRVRRRRARAASLSTAVADQVQWSVARPAGRRRGSQGDHLRPRRRAKHAGTPFGVRHRFLVVVVTLGVLGCGTVLLLTSPVGTKAAGAVLVLVGLTLVTSVAWGRPFRSLHAQTDRGRERTLRLRGMLEREAAGLELIAQVDPTMDPEWVRDQCTARTDAAHRLIGAALGPAVAADFAQAAPPPNDTGPGGPQADADAKAFFVRYLVAYLDKYTVSPDWNP